MAFKDAKRCKAKSKRTGQPCRNPARLEREVYRHHGGNTPAGFGSPHLKTGKHSKYLKTSGRSRQSAAGGEQIFNPVCDLDEEIALNIRHLQELLPLLDERNKDREEVWTQIHQLNEDQRKVRQTQAALLLRQLELEEKLNAVVPVEEFRRFAVTLGKLFALSPEPIELEPLAALQREDSVLPKVIRRTDFTDTPAGGTAVDEPTGSAADYLFDQITRAAAGRQSEPSQNQAGTFQLKETAANQSPPARSRQPVSETERPPVTRQITGERDGLPGAGEAGDKPGGTPEADFSDKKPHLDPYLEEELYNDLKKAGAFGDPILF